MKKLFALISTLAMLPAFAAEYAMVLPGRSAEIDDKLTIEPEPLAAMTGTVYFDARRTVLRLMSNVRSHSFSFKSTTVPNDANPRLLTRMSTVP